MMHVIVYVMVNTTLPDTYAHYAQIIHTYCTYMLVKNAALPAHPDVYPYAHIPASPVPALPPLPTAHVPAFPAFPDVCAPVSPP
jgi:hypothetical protein